MSNTQGPQNILFVASTVPSSDNDPVPAFVKDEAIWFKKVYPDIKVTILAPHNAYSKTKRFSKHEYYDEYRFHYFWPFRLEKLTGRGIAPALKKNKLLYVEVPFLFLTEFIAIWRLVRKLSPDLIYAHWFTPQAIAGALVSKITGVPLVFDTQASDVIVLKKVPFAKKIVVAVCKRAHAYTAPSQQTVDKLMYFTDDSNRKEIRSRLHLIPLGTIGVDVKPEVEDAVRQKYQLQGKKMIYFIGRLVDRKGIDVLIEAFSEMSKQDSSLVLIIVGDGQERTTFENLVAKLELKDKVIFAGYLTGDERFALLNLASIGVIPSVNVGDHAEGLPIVFMEGLTVGKAMVVSDVTGAHEFVKDGEDAFIAKSGSVSDLRDKMREALSVSSNHDAEFYRKVAALSKRFQWPTIVKQRYEAFTIKED